MKKLFVILLSAVMLMSCALPVFAEYKYLGVKKLIEEEGMSFEEISEKLGVTVEEVEYDYSLSFESDAYDPDTFVPWSEKIDWSKVKNYNSITIITRHAFSKYEDDYTVESFPELDLESVYEFTPAGSNGPDNLYWRTSSEYRRLYDLILKTNTKEELVEAIKKLEERAVEFYSVLVLTNNNPEYRPDVDSAYTTKTATAILKHLAGWDVELDKDKADVNTDGEINVKDVSQILRTIAIS